MAGDIRTPDQRVRVFISSTLHELSRERDAAREAVEALRLIPVMFESNARNHPPRDVYRSYLHQSQIFVGIYWQSYGWVAPDSTVSGIEDEFFLAGDRPRLIYLKEPAPDREPQLEAMLSRIRDEGEASYRRFTSAEELAEAVSNDLSLLLSERFAGPTRSHLSPAVLTFMFCDIEGSTALLERLGAGYDEIHRRYHGIVADAVAADGGILEDRTGDGTFSVFADVMAAIRCSVAIETTLAGEAWPAGVVVRPRIGVHTGPALDRPEGYVGLEVHRAARIGDAAQGGQILVSSVTAALVADELSRLGWATQDLGDFVLRGLSRSERLFAVLVPGVIDGAPPPRARKVTASAIPVAMSSLVGRDRDIAKLVSLMHQPGVRLVTLTGAGGIGKTRLAQTVADAMRDDCAFADGLAWIALDAVNDASRVPDAVAQGLGLLDAGRQSITDTIAEYLSDKSMLVVLDNFEQVAEAAPFVTLLLTRAPELKVLVTSRSPLRIQGETEMPVTTLGYPDSSDATPPSAEAYPAIALFMERASAANPNLVLSQDRIGPVAEIVSKLEGLPLAIELAATHVRYLDPEAMASRMTSVLDLLSKGPRDLPERHRTMRATIAWSETLLDEPTRKLFRRLSVFRGSASIASVASVTNWDATLEADPLDGLEQLADVGLIRFAQRHGTGESEITMLRIVREYGRSELEADGQLEQTEQAHAAHFLEIAEKSEPAVTTPDRRASVERLERCLSDIEAAFGTLLRVGDVVGVWRMTAAMGSYMFLRGPYGRSLHLADEAGISIDDELPRGVSPLLAGRAFRSVGTIMFLAGDLARAVPYLRRGVELLDAIGEEIHAARARALLGGAGISAGDPSTVVELATARQAGERLDDLPSFSLASTFTAEVLLAMGDFDGSRALLDEVEKRCRRAGDRWLLGLALLGRGNLAIVTDHPETALEITTECHELLIEEQPPVAGWPLIGLGYCTMSLGRRGEARQRFLEAVATGRRSGDKTIVLAGLIGMAWVVADAGEVERAARLMGAAEAIREATGYQLWSATALLNERALACLAAAGDPDAIEAWRSAGLLLSYEEALALAGS